MYFCYSMYTFTLGCKQAHIIQQAHMRRQSSHKQAKCLSVYVIYENNINQVN